MPEVVNFMLVDAVCVCVGGGISLNILELCSGMQLNHLFYPFEAYF